ncbi:hypothetical protein EBZ80_19175 [bacterium]|nr:hypothetical protein [bacterium]
MILERTFNNICEWVGAQLIVLGLKLSQFRIVRFYVSADRTSIRAMHVAVTPADLNTSMREYVEELDQSYEQ